MPNKKPIIKTLVQSEGRANERAGETAEASEKLSRILKAASSDKTNPERARMCRAIRAFMGAGAVQKRKLLAFCIDFYDPTAKHRGRPSYPAGGPSTVEYSRGVHYSRIVAFRTIASTVAADRGGDELQRLYQFVEEHERDITFSETVFRVMNRHKLTAPQVYKAAMMRRQDYSRAIAPSTKSITKSIVWQIIIGLHCNLDEADEVLFSAGYIRRPTKFDLTMEYFIDNKKYDMGAINDALHELGLKTFSCYYDDAKPMRDRDIL